MTGPDIALITGAGWKPFNEWKLRGQWRMRVPFRTPELLWPLPGGETVLSRYVKQLTSLGVKAIFAGVGDPGNSDPKEMEYRYRVKHNAVVPGYGDSVWTLAKIEQVEEAGATPILIQDPFAGKKTCWTTLIEMFSSTALQCRSWKHAVVLPGDYVLSTAFIREQFGLARYPEQDWLLPRHSMEFLDRDGAVAFIEHLKKTIPHGQNRTWKDRDKLRLDGFYLRYIWDFRKDLPPDERRAYHDKRRQYFCEVGPGEYPSGWKLAEGDPI